MVSTSQIYISGNGVKEESFEEDSLNGPDHLLELNLSVSQYSPMYASQAASRVYFSFLGVCSKERVLLEHVELGQTLWAV